MKGGADKISISKMAKKLYSKEDFG